MTKPTTVYMDSRLLQAVKFKAVQEHKSVSSLVNDALRLSLEEDAHDFEAIHKRKHEPARSFEDALRDLKRDGLL